MSNSSSDLSSNRKYAACMKTLPQPISANTASMDRLPGLATVSAFSSTNPSEMPKSLAFEFYLMNLFLEQNMNIVNKKICRRARSTGSSWSEPTASTPGWTGMRNLLYKRPSPGAQVAQLVEQRTENPCVGGSIPPLGTIAFPGRRYFVV
jgi:hypothetical protein